MNTKKALERINYLKQNLRAIKDAKEVYDRCYKGGEVRVVLTQTNGANSCSFNALSSKILLEALDESQEHAQAELEQLEAVIAMTDMALKGMFENAKEQQDDNRGGHTNERF